MLNQGLDDSAAGPATISRLQTGNILSVEQHEEGRAFDWVRGGLALIPVYDHYAFYSLTIRLSGKNYLVGYETRPVTTLLPGSRATRSKCDRGMDGSTYFATTEQRCLRASLTDPRFVTQRVKEPD